jgi:hypothetical protein
VISGATDGALVNVDGPGTTGGAISLNTRTRSARCASSTAARCIVGNRLTYRRPGPDRTILGPVTCNTHARHSRARPTQGQRHKRGRRPMSMPDSKRPASRLRAVLVGCSRYAKSLPSNCLRASFPDR